MATQGFDYGIKARIAEDKFNYQQSVALHEQAADAFESARNSTSDAKALDALQFLARHHQSQAEYDKLLFQATRPVVSPVPQIVTSKLENSVMGWVNPAAMQPNAHFLQQDSNYFGNTPSPTRQQANQQQQAKKQLQQDSKLPSKQTPAKQQPPHIENNEIFSSVQSQQWLPNASAVVNGNNNNNTVAASTFSYDDHSGAFQIRKHFNQLFVHPWDQFQIMLERESDSQQLKEAFLQAKKNILQNLAFVVQQQEMTMKMGGPSLLENVNYQHQAQNHHHHHHGAKRGAGAVSVNAADSVQTNLVEINNSLNAAQIQRLKQELEKEKQEKLLYKQRWDALQEKLKSDLSAMSAKQSGGANSPAQKK